MPERRHISDKAWQDSQRLFLGHSITERLELAKTRLSYHAAELSNDMTYGLVAGFGFPITSVVLQYFDKGPEWLQKGTAYFGVFMALGSVLKYMEDRQAKNDWTEILDREILNSRPSLAREDLTLARAIYETGIQPQEVDEVANIAQILDYLRKEKVLIDQENVELKNGGN